MKASVLEFNPFGENTYILWNDNNRRSAIVVDPGMMRDSERDLFVTTIADNHLSLTAVLLTHAHLDHAASARWVADRYNVPVMAGKGDEELANALPEQVARFHLKIDLQPLSFDKILTHDDTILLDDEPLKVIETPGHSRGGLSFYAPQSGLVLSGDSLFAGSIGRTDLDGGDFNTLINSIKTQLLTLPDFTLVLPGHGQPTTIADEKQYNIYLR